MERVILIILILFWIGSWGIYSVLYEKLKLIEKLIANIGKEPNMNKEEIARLEELIYLLRAVSDNLVETMEQLKKVSKPIEEYPIEKGAKHKWTEK